MHEGNCTVAEWYFECEFGGVRDEFNGVSIILFNSDEKIISLKRVSVKIKTLSTSFYMHAIIDNAKIDSHDYTMKM
jgi:hypothetical protein